MRTYLFASISLVGVVLLFAFQSAKPGRIEPYKQERLELDPDVSKWSVEDVLIQLGDQKPQHYIEKLDADSVRMGEELVYYGRLKDHSNKRVSKYFVCTDCHNQVLETDDPSDESPARVLDFSKKNKIPFLPGSTFYGMYNKRHWYNGDYAKKYGDLVKNTRDTLYNAIQLCATQCSQGREMDFWEIRCVMHYYKNIQLKVSDLKFSSEEYAQFSNLVTAGSDKAIGMIKGKYNEINDAHFGNSEIPKIPGYEPNVENGEYIYKAGCMHCHAPGRNITNFDLDMDLLSFKFLYAKKDKYNQFSISHITRYGTYAVSGRKQYMPQYTYENMSNEQMLDLMKFIETKAAE
ncbi:MAG: c-type cytochrome [Crocinitomicaceae bacterium]